jgi:NAD(P)-dependent dehydrogenase (short-subunit alcohol dehydrogenase family)
MSDKTQLADKRVLITGGTTGIGRATALLLASRGAQVLIFGRHEQELNDAMHDLQKIGRNVHGMIADASRIGDVRRVFKEVDAKLGRLDILINNAALGAEGLAGMKHEDWEYVVRSNLIGYMSCAQEAINRMKRQKSGHIIHVGSMSADVREKDSSVYVATKSGIQGFTEALRKEINEFGIKVSLVEPGSVGTDMQEESPEEQREKEERGEMLMAEDIAYCIEYCLVQPPRCDVVVVQIRPHGQSI